MYIGVIGEGQCSPEVADLAERVGQAIAARGGVVVCGGLGGVMEAACRGAKTSGGTTIGILPGIDRQSANPHVTVPIVTGLGEARNVLVVRNSDAVIAVGGAYGTLSEIGFALKTGVPVVGLQTWQLVRHEEIDEGIHVASSAEGAVGLAFDLSKAERDR